MVRTIVRMRAYRRVHFEGDCLVVVWSGKTGAEDTAMQTLGPIDDAVEYVE
jgi:hypothetical protein